MIDKIILTDNKFDIEIFNRNLENNFIYFCPERYKKSLQA